MEITVYRGVSDGHEVQGRYYTESAKIAGTYVGWRNRFIGGGAVVSMTIAPQRPFIATSKSAMRDAKNLAAAQGWNSEYVEKFADMFTNKPKSAFVGLVIALEIHKREMGISSTIIENETDVLSVLKSAGYDYVSQTEKGGPPDLDGFILLPKVRHTVWIFVN